MTIERAMYTVSLVMMLGALVTTSGIIYRFFQDRRAKPAKPTPAEPSELDALVAQERWKQATPVAIAAAMQWPVDVKALTLIFHYEDGCNLQMQCGKPERMQVEP